MYLYYELLASVFYPNKRNQEERNVVSQCGYMNLLIDKPLAVFKYDDV